MVIGLCLTMILFFGPFLRPEIYDTAIRDGIEPSSSSASCFYLFTVSHHQVSYVAPQLSSSSLIARPSTAGRLTVLHRLGAHSHIWSTHDKNLRSSQPFHILCYDQVLSLQKIRNPNYCALVSTPIRLAPLVITTSGVSILAIQWKATQ